MRRKRVFTISAVLGVSLIVAGGIVISTDFLGAAGADDFNPRRVVRKFPAITEFPVADTEAADKKLDDAELVLGVEVNGEARAYAINMLTGPRREILNDTLGGRAIAATW